VNSCCAREFLGVLAMPDTERLDVIARRYQRDDSFGIAEMVTGVWPALVPAPHWRPPAEVPRPAVRT